MKLVIHYKTIGKFAWFPMGGILVCAFLSVVLHFETTTSTHCDVDNVLPSISASVGTHMPERLVWRTCAAIQITYLLLDCVAQSVAMRGSPSARWLIVGTKAASYGGLVLLAFCDSNEIYDLHKLGFLLWSICGLVSQISFFTWWNWTAAPNENPEARTFLIKWLSIFFMAGFGLAAAFSAHMWFCAPYAYSFFAVCEWVCVWAYTQGLGFGASRALGYYHGRMVIEWSLEDLSKMHIV